MINHVWSVICARSIVDQMTNNITLMDVIEQLNLQGPPLPVGNPVNVPFAMEFVSLWCRGTDNAPSLGRGRLRLLSPTGTELGVPHEFDINLQEFQRLRTRVALGAIPIQQPGRYTFIIQKRDEGDTDWIDVATVPLQIILTPTTPTT